MSKNIRNRLSVLAWSGALFCALWLLVSAQAAVDHFKQHGTRDGATAPAWTVKVLVPDTAN